MRSHLVASVIAMAMTMTHCMVYAGLCYRRSDAPKRVVFIVSVYLSAWTR